MKPADRIFKIALIALILPVMGWSQSTEYQVDESSSIVIFGTSNVHDWEAEVKEMDLSVFLDPARLGKENPENPVTNVTLNVPVESIESGKGGMDKRIRKALKHDDHPEIMFNINSAEMADTVLSDNAFMIDIKGNLNIAGVVKEVTFPVKGVKTESNGYRFEGSYSMNMTDYEVDPPSAMFGAIKSGEEVRIEFNILLNAKQS